MGFKNSSLLCLAVFLAFSSSIHGFNITRLLGQYPEFGMFNQYLTETKLAEQINRRNTITVLALENSALSSLSGKPQETIKAIISTHVILDYYDEKKLVEATGNHTQLVTLFQASGLARNNEGFVYASLINEGEVAFASGVKGSPFNTLLVRTVATQPYNISVLQVNQPIVAPSIDASAGSSSSSTPPPAAAKAPVASTAPPPAEEVVAESPEEEAVAPAADAPAADGPAAEESDAADGGAAPHNSSSRTQIGLVGAVMAFVSLFVSL